MGSVVPPPPTHTHAHIIMNWLMNSYLLPGDFRLYVGDRDVRLKIWRLTINLGKLGSMVSTA